MEINDLILNERIQTYDYNNIYLQHKIMFYKNLNINNFYNRYLTGTN